MRESSEVLVLCMISCPDSMGINVSAPNARVYGVS